jgi:anaphase-promoting complex subunit 4
MIPSVQVIQVKFTIEKGISTVNYLVSSAVQLGEGQVKDLKFSDESVLLVLWESKGKS